MDNSSITVLDWPVIGLVASWRLCLLRLPVTTFVQPTAGDVKSIKKSMYLYLDVEVMCRCPGCRVLEDDTLGKELFRNREPVALANQWIFFVSMRVFISHMTMDLVVLHCTQLNAKTAKHAGWRGRASPYRLA